MHGVIKSNIEGSLGPLVPGPWSPGPLLIIIPTQSISISFLVSVAIVTYTHIK